VTGQGLVSVTMVRRDARWMKVGDEVVSRVEAKQAVLPRAPAFVALAGTIRVPAAKRSAACDDVIRMTRAARASKRR